MKAFIPMLFLLALPALVLGEGCVSKSSKKPCLTAENNPGYYKMYEELGGNPCLNDPDPEWGGTFCFVTTEGSMEECDCSVAACGCKTPPPPNPNPEPEWSCPYANGGGEEQQPNNQTDTSGGTGGGGDDSGQCVNEGVVANGDCKTIQEKYCKPEYDENGAKNTLCSYCGFNLNNCQNAICKFGLDQADKDAIVKAHNDLRLKIAKGDESIGNPGPQPNAANMREMVWDDELALSAQTWVQQCQWAHDKARKTSEFLQLGVGQNIAMTANSVLDRSEQEDRILGASAAANMVQMWYDEVKDWPGTPEAIGKFGSVITRGVTGHYTQVVWAKSWKVGCGYIQFKNNGMFTKYLYCNYGPSGNYGGEPLYIIGKPGTACPAGTTNNNGLCKKA